ncbi:hypothetical protein A9Q99_00435 [Gammaproteobacteria bacterium 45_16_T64]|nr:hypothetical protein A9Q99_00435 [Gammaproteobacteria bacterium 45_16_T64]
MMVPMILAMATLLSQHCHAYEGDRGFLFRSITVDNNEYTYQVYVPNIYAATAPSPLILFLHGAGERGDSGLLPTETGLGSAIRKKPSRFPSIVVFPQCPLDNWWGSSLCNKIANNAMKDTLEEFLIDTQRMYLTGVSMGGYGVWNMAASNVRQWAAIVPIAGRLVPGGGHKPSPGTIPFEYKGDAIFKETAKMVQNVPIWIIHGELDNVVPVSESRNIFQHLESDKNVNLVRYSEMAEMGHNVWDTAYNNVEIIDWMFSQRLTPQ